jgi:maltooligosyltrehalose trehalohydrolase
LGLHAQWSDDFHHSLHALLTGERTGYYADFGQLAQLASALREGFVYAGGYSTYRRRSHGRPLGELPLQRLLGYLQNHDQVGNRALGDRIGHNLSVERLEIGAALVLTAPFVPMLFQGEEWNASTPFRYFTDHQNAALADAVREGRRREFVAQGLQPEVVPDPQAPATFDASKLDWAEQALPEHRRVLDWYRALLQLRRQEPALRSPEAPEVEAAENAAGARWLRVRRGTVLIIANLSSLPLALPVGAGASLLLGSAGASVATQLLRVPAWGVGILRTTSRHGAGE